MHGRKGIKVMDVDNWACCSEHKNEARERQYAKVQPCCVLPPLFRLWSLCAAHALQGPQILDASCRLCHLVIFYPQHFPLEVDYSRGFTCSPEHIHKRTVGLTFDSRLWLQLLSSTLQCSAQGSQGCRKQKRHFLLCYFS